MEKNQLVSTVCRWGGSCSDAALEDTQETFVAEGIEGIIRYRKLFNCRIVFGNPIAPPEQMVPLAKAFIDHSNSLNQRAIFLMATDPFVNEALSAICSAAVECCQELYLDPYNDPQKQTGERGHVVRRKVRHAEKEGVSVGEYGCLDEQKKQMVTRLSLQWLKEKKRSQMHVSNLHLFDHEEIKRWFYAEYKGELVAAAQLHRLKAHEGWLLNYFMILKEAPKGTPELLVIDILNHLRNEGCHYLTFGCASSGQLGKIIGLNRFSTWIARSGYSLIKKFFAFEGSFTFWNKFNPQQQPSYLLLDKKRLGLRTLLAIIKAFNG